MSITIVELAQIAGVSDTTVSLVLTGKDRGRVSAARRKRILDLAEKHGYRPNLVARGLVKGLHYRIGICWGGPLASEEVLGQVNRYQRLALFGKGFHEAGYAIELMETDPDQSDEQVCRMLLRRPADGFVLIGWPEDRARKALFHLKVHRKPAIGSELWLDDPDLTWTVSDTPASVRDAVQRLVAEGKDRIAFVLPAKGENEVRLRSAFLDAMQSAAHRDAAPLLIEPAEWNPPDIRRLTCEAIQRTEGLQAVLLYDTYYGNDILDAVRRANREPGKDLRIIGFGSTLLADRTTPKLSHYSFSLAQQVAFGIEALLEQIRDCEGYAPRHKLFGPEYLARET